MPWKKLSRWSAALLVLGCAASESRADISVNVPLEHWSYRLIERFEARGFLSGLGDGIKPLSRLEIARALALVAAQVDDGAEVTRIEREELLLLQEEFRAELEELGAPAGKRPVPGRLRGGRPLYHYRCV